VRRLAWLLLAWWALFRWEPITEPPGWVLFGPFESLQQCRRWAIAIAPDAAARFGWLFDRCMEVEVRP
jgi:hypothetical protein